VFCTCRRNVVAAIRRLFFSSLCFALFRGFSPASQSFNLSLLMTTQQQLQNSTSLPDSKTQANYLIYIHF